MNLAFLGTKQGGDNFVRPTKRIMGTIFLQKQRSLSVVFDFNTLEFYLIET